MHKILRARILVASVFVALSCYYVHWFNYIGSNVVFVTHMAYIALLMDFFAFEKYAFIIPVIGFLLALMLPKMKRRMFLYLVPDMLYGFAFALICICIFFWFAQMDSRLDIFIKK